MILKEKYDYLIVGSGIMGAVFAYFANKKGRSCLIVEKRDHIGGNIFTEEMEGIQVHKYGAHIFHTNNKKVWDFINHFSEFNHFINSPLVYSGNKLYHLPFNMNTYHQLWGVTNPDEARKIIDEQRKPYLHLCPANLEEQALQLVGKDIYEILIKEYTEKQWGKNPSLLPPEIIKRLPVRFTYDNNYFNDPLQGIPIGGYTHIIKQWVKNSDILLNTDFYQYRKELSTKADIIIHTGKIDEYYDYCYGKLEYRSLKFEHEIIPKMNFQGNAVINYADKEIPYTRIIEHKHFEFGKQEATIITKEFPVAFNQENEAFYPVNDFKNNQLYALYQQRSQQENNLIIFCGRLGEYAYCNMDQVIKKAMELSGNIIK